MEISAKKVSMVGVVLAVGFVGDVLTYSLAESKGKPFGIHIPRGWALFNLVALGVATGLLLDPAVELIQQMIRSKEEKELVKLVEKEQQKIDKGLVKNKIPNQ
jgi:hypothetical protein